jgi:bifunctional DNA-binding transcriptional regulator/antitoxin component of YhaV-PrlF toxin-antitoxin module
MPASTVSARHTTIVPRGIREALRLLPGDRLEWRVTSTGAIHVHRSDVPARPNLDEVLQDVRRGRNTGPASR